MAKRDRKHKGAHPLTRTTRSPPCFLTPPLPRSLSLGAGGVQALTVVLVDQAVADLIGRDLAIGFGGLSPAQLGHGGGDDVESQTPRLTGYWGLGGCRKSAVSGRERAEFWEAGGGARRTGLAAAADAWMVTARPHLLGGCGRTPGSCRDPRPAPRRRTPSSRSRNTGTGW